METILREAGDVAEYQRNTVLPANFCNRMYSTEELKALCFELQGRLYIKGEQLLQEEQDHDQKCAAYDELFDALYREQQLRKRREWARSFVGDKRLESGREGDKGEDDVDPVDELLEDLDSLFLE